MSSREQWAVVDRYLEEVFVPHDVVLEAVREASAEAGLPQHAVSPTQGKLLWTLARMVGARRILELGTLGGYSGVWLARALPADGRLITLEANAGYADVARANFVRAGLDHVVEVRVGAALQTLPHLASESGGPFDLTFIDADKASYAEYLGWALELSRRGSVIVVDNVVRDGAVADAETDDLAAQGVRRMNAVIAAEPRVSATAIQTVGDKGWDGFALALVTADR
jgi:predicted O-methyltransferase YrrM